MLNSIYEQNFLQKMPDGTVKQVNPFTGTQVWTVPGRGKRPTVNKKEECAKPVNFSDVEDFCSFCPSNYLKTPPEKSRLVKNADGTFSVLENLKVSQLFETTAEFRRIPNLFEIISYEYWEKNYAYVISDKANAHREAYIAEPEGREHVLNIVQAKLKMSGLSREEIDSISSGRKLKMANSFFAGGHELIIGKRHFIEGASSENAKASSGSMTPEMHYQYINFTIAALKDIYLNNRYVRYVTVFQNWLNQAGASFDHLHKQLVAIDGISASNEAEFKMSRENPNVYNDFAVNYAGYQNLIFAENDYAVAFADFGHRYPTLAIYSKAEKNQPWNQTPEQIKGMSDLVHACHAAMGSEIPCNEEWYYRPPAVDVAVPWHILIKWRISNPAGFEAVTKIFVNTVDPWTLRDRIVNRLFELRKEEKLAKGIKIAAECDCIPNCLMYNPTLQPTSAHPYAMRGRGTTMDM
ncbi:MAG: DUF4921 family protein [Alphaproteobacteria bacterium]|nr:DUF4921 family protein [Alphaproteobacteria bacterium]